jgi:hypothetical protein
MNPSRILPDLQCALLCEDVRQEVNGNFLVLGIMNVIRVPQVPITAARLCLFNRWVAGYGQFLETVRFIAPDQTTVLRKNDLRFALQDVAFSATTASILSPVQLETPGAYYVEVLVDDVMKLRFPISVIVAPPEQRPPAGGPKKEP